MSSSEPLQALGAPRKPRRVNVLLNANSGTTAGKSRDGLRNSLQTAFRSHDIAANLQFLPSDDLGSSAERALRDVISGEADAIIVGGGDGSIRTVAAIIAGSGVPLGILPLGTLNHFAKDLKIPLAIDEAVGIIAAGETSLVDMGEANGKLFINNSSIGIYPYLVLDRERRRHRQKLPKWLAMGIASLKVLRNLPIRHLSINAKQWKDVCRSPCVFIGNNEYHLTGPGLGSRERLDGGQLCLYVAKQEGRAALLWLATRSILGLVHQESDLRSVLLTAVEIVSHRKRILVAFDGEIETLQSPIKYQIRPGALRVFAKLR